MEIPVRKALFLLTFGAAVLLGLIFLTPEPPHKPLTDLPWQIQIQPDGTSKVLGVHLGRDRLAEVMDGHGEPEGLALFEAPGGFMTLEAYFGTVRVGPLAGKLVARLEASPDELAALRARAIASEVTRSGERRYLLKDADKRAQIARKVSGLSYIPAFGKLDAELIRSRFGEPARIEQIDPSTQQWHYPGRGVTVLLDLQGKEVFEYRPPGAGQ
jgi:hypothetical protein